jgi:DNA-binding CsgD family transcriptional regulator
LLVLSQADMRRCDAALQTLLSPLEYGGLTSWGEAVGRSLAALFATENAVFLLASGTTVATRILGVGAATEKLICADFDAPNDLDPALQPMMIEKGKWMATLAAHNAEAWNNQIGERVTGIPLKRLTWYQEIMRPARMVHLAAMHIDLDSGMVAAGVTHPDNTTNPLADSEIEVMTLLLPALKAGARLATRLNGQRSALAYILDTLREPIAIYSADGEERHRNPALQQILNDEPEYTKLVSMMRALALDLMQIRRPPRKSGDGSLHATGSRVVTTVQRRYTLRATYLGPGALSLGSGVLVALERGRPVLPSIEQLQESYGLTEREAEIALHLAVGRSNREISEHLSISAHTVRHHSERIFDKLGVHSRKALALKLL